MSAVAAERPRRVLEGKGVEYAAQRLGCSVANIYRLVESGDLPWVDVGAVRNANTRRRPTLRFLDEDLDAFIAKRRQAARPAEIVAPRPVIRGRFS